MESRYTARRGGKSRRRPASVNGDVVSNAFCSRTADTSKTFLNEKSDVCAVDFIRMFVWAEVRK